jgi:peptide/nickel transport system substrate-binding protein
VALLLLSAALVFAGGKQEGAGSEGATTTTMSTTGKQAPELKVLVERGELPPLEDRLPEEPMVLEAYEEIGTYGGTIKSIKYGPSYGAWQHQYMYEAPYRWNSEATAVEPNLAVSHQYSDDGLSCTITFRKGVKWSDGEPFTTEDLDFWWNDLVMNENNSYTQPYWTITAQKPMRLEVVDDYTIRVQFNEPHWLFHELMASTSDYIHMYAPKHYLSQYHPDYNSDMEDFTELEKRFLPDDDVVMNTELPVLFPWVTVEYNPGQNLIAERNPYYWKVDEEGKQLPYIDRWEWTQVEDPRVVPLKIVSGEVDFKARGIPLDSFRVLKDSESKGDYRVIQWKVGAGGDPAIVLNWDNPNPVMQDLIRNKDFRYALSMAFDRETINDVVYFGLGTPSQAVTSPYSPWGRTTEEGERLMEQWRNLATDYDPDEARLLLDRVGLTERDADGYRLRPDGKRLSIVIITGSTPDSRAVDVLEFVAEGWEDIGIETSIRSMDWGSGFWPKFSNGEYDVAGWDAWTGYYIPTIPDTLFPIGSAYWGTPLTARYFNTRGEEGNEPEPGGPMDRMIDMYSRMLAAKTPEGRNQAVLDAVRVHVEEGPFFLAAVNDIPNLVVARPDMRNIPDFAFTGSWAQGAPGCTNPPMYFYDN